MVLVCTIKHDSEFSQKRICLILLWNLFTMVDENFQNSNFEIGQNEKVRLMLS
jgi:hypothetical protein